MAAMKELATVLGVDYAREIAVPVRALDASAGFRVNQVAYPYPNRLGLIKPTPYVETITGRTVIVRV